MMKFSISVSPLPSRQPDNNGGSRRNCNNGARPRSSSFRTRRPSNDEVQMRRRRVDSLNLETPYHSDYDPMTHTYSMPEAFVEGQELYLHFFHEQVRNAGLGDVSLEEDFE